MSGYTNSFGAGGNDLWILKLNSDGTVAWQKTYGGTGNDGASSIQQTSDGGYIVAGYTSSFGAGSYDFWALKLESDGSIVWQKTYGGAGYDYARPLIQAWDGGYIGVGYTDSFGAGGYDFLVYKLDSFGNIEGCEAQGTSSAVVTPTSIIPANTSVIPASPNFIMSTNSPIAANTGVTPEVVCEAPVPDLIVQYIATNPTIPGPGQNVAITMTVKNQGTGTAENFYVDFYKHLTSTPTPHQAGDIRCSVVTLAPGATTTCGGTVSYAPAGNYSMWGQVDTEDSIIESNESNNVYGPQTIIVDGTPPTGSILINGGATYTNTTSVTLTLSCSDTESGCYQMRLSNDRGPWSAWELYITSKSWTLTSGNGTKFVDVQFKDKVGNVSTEWAIWDSIILQTNPCECDLNHDGRCDMLDWLIFGQDWGRTDCLMPGVTCECDLNVDGKCDMLDWLLFGQDWGRTDCPIL